MLERVHPGVYRIAGVPPTWEQRVRGATLWAGAGSVASHTSAAAGLGLCDRDDTVHVTTERRLHPLPPGITVHHRGPLPPEDVTCLHGIPMTTMPRTIVDLAQIWPLGRLETALVRASRQRMSMARLEARARALRRPGEPGAARLRLLLRGESESELSTIVRRILVSGGLPAPRREHKVMHGGAVVARVDLAYPDKRIAIEADGWRWHRELDDFAHDRKRQNRLVLLGWLLLRFTWADADTRPSVIVATTRRALLRR